MRITASAFAAALLLAGVGDRCGGDDPASVTDRGAVSTLPSEQQHLGSAPGACRGAKPEVIPIESPLVEAMGLPPVWLAVDGALLDPQGRVFYVSRDTPFTSAGWELLTVWVFDVKREETITVSGRELGRDGDAILFAPRGRETEPTPTLVLEPSATPTAGRLREREARVYIKRGSCFAIEAERAGKRTRFVVGIGL